MCIRDRDYRTYLRNYPDKEGRFGPYGGAYLTEELKPAFEEISEAYLSLIHISFAVLIGKGEADRKTLDTLNLTNEYDLIVSYLMQSTAAEETFEKNYEQNYLN